MSKKMLKRSLALGALMAFVITGSAMAAEVDYSTFIEGANKNVINVTEDTVVKAGDSAQSLHGYTLNVGDGVNLTLNEISRSGYSGGVKNITGNGNVTIINNLPGVALDSGGTINVKNLSVTSNDNNTATRYDSAKKGGSITIVATEDVYFHTGDHAIHTEGGNVKIEARNVTIENELDDVGRNIINSYGGSVEITARGDFTANRSIMNYPGEYDTGNIEIIANNINVGQVLNYADGAVILNATNDLSAKKEGTVLYLGEYSTTTEGTGHIILSAGGKMEVEGDVINDGISNIEASFNGSGSYLKGAANNNGNGKIDFEFNDGAKWEVTGASTVTNATFGAGSNLVLKGDGTQFTKDGDFALNGVGTADVLKVDSKANIKVEGVDYKKYNVATGFENVEAAKTYWNVSNLNSLMQGEWVGNAKDGLQLNVIAKEATDVAEELGVSEATGDFLSNLAEDAGNAGDVEEGSAKDKLKGLANAAANSQNDKVIAKAAAQAAEAVQKMAEAGGNSATAAKVVTNVTGVTNQRLSLNNGNHGGNKGGHGVGLLEEGSGAAIWAQYVHGKDNVEDMPSEAGASSYEGQYNGIVMGVDFKKVGKFQSGIAFNYGEGDTNSVNTTSPTRSDYDFWGVGYYGNIRNADSNVIFDIGYAKTDSDVTNNVNIGGFKQTYEASPETTTWTAGVKVEKLYQNNNVQIVPYTGLRYMSIDPDDYSTKCGALSYNLERQDIWLLPVGVSIRQEVVNPNGWVVTPKVDLSYIWAFGDTDSSMETNTVFGSDNRPIGYDVMDDGSWMGLVGVEAAMDDWTFGVSYSYQKGDHSESKKWYVDAKYSF